MGEIISTMDLILGISFHYMKKVKIQKLVDSELIERKIILGGPHLEVSLEKGLNPLGRQNWKGKICWL